MKMTALKIATPETTTTGPRPTSRVAKKTLKPDPDFGYVSIEESPGHDFLWMQIDLVPHKMRKIGLEAFAIYSSCCYFGCHHREFSLQKMSELSSLSVAWR